MKSHEETVSGKQPFLGKCLINLSCVIIRERVRWRRNEIHEGEIKTDLETGNNVLGGKPESLLMSSPRHRCVLRNLLDFIFTISPSPFCHFIFQMSRKVWVSITSNFLFSFCLPFNSTRNNQGRIYRVENFRGKHFFWRTKWNLARGSHVFIKSWRLSWSSNHKKDVIFFVYEEKHKTWYNLKGWKKSKKIFLSRNGKV